MKRLLCVAAAAATMSACVGPFTYMNTTVRKARRAVADARAADAEKLAPYEYWSAVEYYKMASEAAGNANYEHAWKYGNKAVEMSKKARNLAKEKGEAGPTATPTTDAPVRVEPAAEEPPPEQPPAVDTTREPDASSDQGGTQ